MTTWTMAEMNRVRALIADGKTAREISEICSRGRKSIIMQVKKHGLGPWQAKPGTKKGDTSHIPADFAERWANTSQADLCAHYARGSATISLWCKRLGLVRMQGKKMTPAAKPVRSSSAKLQPFHKTALAPQRDMSSASLAADYLRRFSAVTRCDAGGRYDPKGRHWLRGSTLLTAEEVIERAYRNGWQPDAWKAIAA